MFTSKIYEETKQQTNSKWLLGSSFPRLNQLSDLMKISVIGGGLMWYAQSMSISYHSDS